MGLRLQRIALVIALASTAQAADQPPAVETPPVGVMKKLLLQDTTPYEVAVGAVPTTILMPFPIDGMDGNGITTQAHTVAPVFLQHEQGTRFFSVKALLPGTADLNVIIGERVYSFRFYYSENPTRTLSISEPKKGSSIAQARRISVTPKRLHDILNDAKTYFVIKKQHPELQRSIEVAAPGKVIEYPGYRVVIDQVFRFDRDDTLVFRAIFINDSDEPLHYKPQEVGLRVGRNIYWPSFAQLPGEIPARNPARVTWELSPEIETVAITDPEGRTAEVKTKKGALLSQTGRYKIVASTAKRRTDTLYFSINYPVSADEPNPLVVSKGDRDFGIRKLTVTQPEAGQNIGYITYTGTSDGRRADISIDNDFLLVVDARKEVSQ
ncbi:hypothetical protein [Termitidicoccus mucosus]|uniref:hypothetical protein n=1 Tax=Termitidicoccus mucosus TaxID=1184151 RepID=UPI0011AB72B4